MLASKTNVTAILPHPPAPTTLDEAGLSLDIVIQLVLKTLHFTGELPGSELANRLGLRFSVIEPALALIKSQHQVEVAGGAIIGGPSYRYRITDAGRARAQLFLETNHYVGAAPVPLAQYKRYMAEYKLRAPSTATRDRVRQAFGHLVISDRVMDQLGPAINAGHSMFVYGPPGNGKTVISQAIRNLMPGDLMIPHALEIDGSLIQVFDPVNHEPYPPVPAPPGLESKGMIDRRWVRCRRPAVMVGGELTLEHLELTYNPNAGFYRSPVQLLANGGVLIVDDFGRQQIAPQALLNRWITPLESRIDFLTLQSGQKVEIPFMLLPVFATNIKPIELVDEAFLRRIQYKVFAENPTADDFRLIFSNVCREKGIPHDPALVNYLLTQTFPQRNVKLRGCQPRDLINQALGLAMYRDEPPVLTVGLLEAACDTYFVDENEGVSRA